MDCSPPVSSSMGFPRQEYWSGLPFPSPGDLPDPGNQSDLQANSLLLSHQGLCFFHWKCFSFQIYLSKFKLLWKDVLPPSLMNLYLGASTPHFLSLRATGVTTDGAPNVCLSRCQVFYICYLIVVFKKTMSLHDKTLNFSTTEVTENKREWLLCLHHRYNKWQSLYGRNLAGSKSSSFSIY